MDRGEGPIKTSLRTVAIIPAAGAGERMGTERTKQYLDLDGRPLLGVTLERFQECLEIDSIILVVPPQDVDYCRRRIVEQYHLSKVARVVGGGKRRQDSVRMGIEATRGDCGIVVIHDGARPLIDTDLIVRAVASARENRAVITALPAKETVKEIDESRLVVKTRERRRLWLVQTPQVFRYDDIREAHRRALEEGWEEATDDAFLMEKMGIPVTVIEGSEYNIKVTTPSDLELARFLLKKRG